MIMRTLLIKYPAPRVAELKDRIRELRKENGWTAPELARLLEKTDSAIRMWESGKS